MKSKLTKDNFLILGLSVLFVVASFEIIAYFFYIYKPASHIMGKPIGYQLEIPAVSQILKPGQITDDSMSLEESTKTFFPEKLYNFKSQLDAKLTSENTFIKDSKVSYILAGTVTNVKKSKDGSIEVALKNSTNRQVKESFSAADLMKIKTTLIILSISNPSRVETSLENAAPDDTLVIKKSVNLLDKDSDPVPEVEIFRLAK